MRTRLHHLLRQLLTRLTGRHPVLLPRVAGRGEALLTVRGPYRVEADARGEPLVLELPGLEPGRLEVTLLAYDGHFPRRRLGSVDGEIPPHRPTTPRLEVVPGGGPVTLCDGDGRGDEGAAPVVLGDLPGLAPGERRFALHLVHRPHGGGPARERLTGHYRPGDGAIGEAYFHGETYVDHEAQSAGEAERIVELLARFGGREPVLEVGAATGAVVEALAAAGHEARGLDASAWAVERAAERLGPGRVLLADAEEALPASIVDAAPWGAVVAWAVAEHFADPFSVLERLGRLVSPGGLLLLETTNATSLTRRLFGRDWEGHFDWTHRGVTALSAESLRRRLPEIGWRPVVVETRRVWTGSADPTHATLRDWWDADARFRALVEENDLGDFVTVVAVRSPEEPHQDPAATGATGDTPDAETPP